MVMLMVLQLEGPKLYRMKIGIARTGVEVSISITCSYWINMVLALSIALANILRKELQLHLPITLESIAMSHHR